ncbi:GNAT family N-acetyltransferase [Streptomyces sp. NPDC058662]|uniref:GNAT family N-acetyltransferase n=1 Tax=Streptomyces sp. NPDC058662 TaxID=3346583 RepID=UPI00365171A4
MSDYVIRPVHSDEWEKVKELRMTALRDPVAHLAFLEDPEQAAAQPDEFWQQRAARVAQGRKARQFIAEAGDGRWLGTVTLLVEEAGSTDFFEQVVEREQGHLVGVFVRPEQRGTGLTEKLFEAALEWAWSLEGPALGRVRLIVHEDNARAEAFYQRFGFVATGVVLLTADGDAKEREYVYGRPAL